MSFIKTFLQKLFGLFLSFIRMLRKAICCRKRQQYADMILPLTISHKDISDNWDTWDVNKQSVSAINNSAASANADQRMSSSRDAVLSTSSSNADEDDYFKDMTPQFRKPKKLVVAVGDENISHSNRLSMDPNSFLPSNPDLGLLEENTTHWETCEDIGENWDADSLIKEKKLAEREQRIAEHQRRKQERDAIRVKQK